MIIDRLHKTVDLLYLIYLGLLPSIAVFVVLIMYGTGYPFLLFFGGIVLVSVYLAVVISYTPKSSSLITALIAFLDGPIFAAISDFANPGFNTIAIDSFLIEGIAIWIAILWLAVSTNRPTKEQRIGTIILGIIAFGTISFSFFQYIDEYIFSNIFRFLGLLAGIIEAVMVNHFVLKADIIYRDSTASSKYIIIFIFIWIAAMCVGMNIATSK
ncbi:MAG: hypothetical protein V1720_07060 [bacterium]